VTSIVLLVLGLGCLSEGVVNGTASVHVGYPLSANSIRFCGASVGGWAIAGVLATIGAMVFNALALIRSLTHEDSSRAG